MFERFNDSARRVVVLTQEEARALNHDVIASEHLVLGLLRESDGAAARALEVQGATLERARSEVERVRRRGTSSPAGQIPFTQNAKKALEYSLRAAVVEGATSIGDEHILLGLSQLTDSRGVEVLRYLGVDVDRLHKDLLDAADASAAFERDARAMSAEPAPASGSIDERLKMLAAAVAELDRKLDRVLRRLDG